MKSTAGSTATKSFTPFASGSALKSTHSCGGSNDGVSASRSRSCRFISIVSVPCRGESSGFESPFAGSPGSSWYSSFSTSTGSVSTIASPGPVAPISQYFTSPCPSAVRWKKRVSWLRSGSSLNVSRSVTSRSAETSTWSTPRSRSTRSMGRSVRGGVTCSVFTGAAGGGRVHFHTP